MSSPKKKLKRAQEGKEEKGKRAKESRRVLTDKTGRKGQPKLPQHENPGDRP